MALSRNKRIIYGSAIYLVLIIILWNFIPKMLLKNDDTVYLQLNMGAEQDIPLQVFYSDTMEFSEDKSEHNSIDSLVSNEKYYFPISSNTNFVRIDLAESEGKSRCYYSCTFFPTVLGEDVYLNIHAYSCGGNISYTDYVGYRWVRNVKSLSNTLHRKYDESVSVISLFDKLLENENSDSWRNDKYYQYFFLKTAIYHILFVSRDTKFDELMRYEDAIFKWFAVNMRGTLKNSLIGLGKPDGERLWIRVLVTCFMMLRRWNLDKIFLVTVSIAQRLLLLNPFLFGVFSKKPFRKKAGNE